MRSEWESRDADAEAAAALWERVQDARVDALFSMGLFAYLTNIVNGAVLVAVIDGLVAPWHLWGWFGALSLLTLVRAGLWYRHRRRAGAHSRHGWLVRYSVGLAASGVVWGSGAVLLWPAEQVVLHALLGFAAGGMVAGATVTASAYLPTFLIFAFAALPPYVARMLSAGEPVDAGMGIMLAVFGVAMVALAARGQGWFLANTRLAMRNQALADRLTRARDELDRRVVERTAELERAVEELRAAEAEARRAIKARDDFLAMASHELRTPLTTLQLHLSSFQVLVARGAIQDRAKLDLRVQVLRRQVTHLTHLANTVLAASGLTGSAAAPPQVLSDLSAVVRSVVDDFRAVGEPGSAELTLTRAESVVGHWDAVRVEQVVSNLLSNAVKYGAGRPVEIEVRGKDGEAEIAVRDHGPGIPAWAREHLFERFFHADSGPGIAGLGLGLFVVRQLVDAMRGSVSVWSEPGQGALFTVSLPWPAATAAR